MSRQLVLIPTSGADWRLDERTRDTGRKGVAAAREVLRLADERVRRSEADASVCTSQGRRAPAPVASPRKPAA